MFKAKPLRRKQVVRMDLLARSQEPREAAAIRRKKQLKDNLLPEEEARVLVVALRGKLVNVVTIRHHALNRHSILSCNPSSRTLCPKTHKKLRMLIQRTIIIICLWASIHSLRVIMQWLCTLRKQRLIRGSSTSHSLLWQMNSGELSSQLLPSISTNYSTKNGRLSLWSRSLKLLGQRHTRRYRNPTKLSPITIFFDYQIASSSIQSYSI